MSVPLHFYDFLMTKWYSIVSEFVVVSYHQLYYLFLYCNGHYCQLSSLRYKKIYLFSLAPKSFILITIKK